MPEIADPSLHARAMPVFQNPLPSSYVDVVIEWSHKILEFLFNLQPAQIIWLHSHANLNVSVARLFVWLVISCRHLAIYNENCQTKGCLALQLCNYHCFERGMQFLCPQQTFVDSKFMCLYYRALYKGTSLTYKWKFSNEFKFRQIY